MRRVLRPVTSAAFLALLLLGWPAAQTIGVAQRPDIVPAELTQIAQTQGSVRVIVELGVTTQPEGAMTAPAQALQRLAIANAQSQALAALPPAGHRVTRQFVTIPFIALEVTPAALGALAQAATVRGVTEDLPVATTLAQSVPLVQGTQAWAAGFDGNGWSVAILDTGVDKAHSFLSGKVVEEACYSGNSNCPNGLDTQVGVDAGVPCSFASACLHGTHVAGIAAGQGATFSGVAKGASVIAIQVFSRFTGSSCINAGEDPCALTYSSDQIFGLERVYALRLTRQIAAANMSLGGGKFTSQAACDAANPGTKAVIDNLRAAGIATVISSGNDSHVDGLGQPGCISSAISVGSTTKSDVVSSFSNSASFLSLLAPGSSINSSVPGGGFASLSGTSMAAPHVTGAWAIARQRSPSSSVQAVLSAFQSTGLPILDTRNGLTLPRIRINDALTSLTTGGCTSIQNSPVSGGGTSSSTPLGRLAMSSMPSSGVPAGGSWQRSLRPGGETWKYTFTVDGPGSASAPATQGDSTGCVDGQQPDGSGAAAQPLFDQPSPQVTSAAAVSTPRSSGPPTQGASTLPLPSSPGIAGQGASVQQYNQPVATQGASSQRVTNDGVAGQGASTQRSPAPAAGGQASSTSVTSATPGTPNATVDFVAGRAYLRTAASGGGTEVTTPLVGQTVYLHFDWTVTGASGTATYRAVLDGSTYCNGSVGVAPGSLVSSCTIGWTATAGTHTLQWDLDYLNAVVEASEVNNSAAVTFTPTAGVDVAATRAYLRTATNGGGTEVVTPTVGQAVFFHADWTVAGGSPTVAFRAVLDSTTFCSGSGAVSPGGWFSSCTSGWTATAGSHTLQWDFDYLNTIVETNESNNSASKTFTPTGGLDLAATRAYLRTATNGGGAEVATPTVGQSVFFHADWTVAGGSPTVAFRAVLDSTTFCSGSGAVSPGSWFSSCTSGWTATAGSHTLQWDFDYLNAIVETNESNNSASKTFTPTGGLDLAATRAYLRTATNGGGTEVTTSAVGQVLFFHADWTVAGGSPTVAFRAVLDSTTFCSGSGAVSPGSWFSSCTSGWTATAGSHTLQWDFDYLNAIVETNESNNSASLTFTPTAGLDVAATRAYLRTAASGGGSEVTTPNVGQAVYFHADWTVAGGSPTVAFRAVLDATTFCSGSGAVSPGGWFSSCTSPWTATAGSHTLQWDFDYTNAIAETNEANNSASKTFTPIQGLDLAATRAYLRTATNGGGSEVTTPAVGQAVYFHADWTVAGGSPTVAFRAVLDATTFCSGSSPVSPGGWFSSCTSPWTATAGSHTLQWDFDYTNAIVETDETNNSASKVFTPTTPSVDLIADRAYLRTAANSGGTEVVTPADGQSVYPHLDWHVTGTGGAIQVPLRVRIDGVDQCVCTNSALPGFAQVSSCASPWVATPGAHTMVWDLDYSGTVPETNEVNNSASANFTVGGAPSTRVINLSGSLAFGNAAVGSTPTRLLTINNAGNSTLTVSSISYPAGFSGVFAGQILAGASQNVTVTFSPVAVTTYSGTVTVNSDKTSGTETAAASGAGVSGGVRFDFTADGKSDVLWRHTSLGQVWIWPMNGAAKLSEAFVRTVSDTNWEIRGQGDQNGDGQADILWRNKVAGAVVYWPMNGTVPQAETYLGTVDPGYDIVGTGDYNGDGKSDILWRHTTNGQVWIWLMNGAVTLSVVHVDTVDPIYAIVGSGDLNADTKADIVWRSTISGDVWVWLMNGTTRLSQTLVGSVPDLGYQVMGVADYTNDGKADILWRHTTQGHVWIWPMNGAAVLSQTFVATVDPIYVIVGTGDYNGDGKADILWHHSTVGDVWVWLMNGTVMQSQTLVGRVPDLGYQIVKNK